LYYVILYCSAPLSSIVSGAIQIHFVIVIVWLWSVVDFASSRSAISALAEFLFIIRRCMGRENWVDG